MPINLQPLIKILDEIKKEAEEREGLEIQQHLVISSAHISDKAAEFLNDQARVTEDPGIWLLIVDKVREYGWRICLAEEATKEFFRHETPGKGLAEAIQFALSVGADWLQIDRDGCHVDALRIYDSEADGPAQTAQGYDEEDCYMDADGLAAKYGTPSGVPNEIVPVANEGRGHPYHRVFDWTQAVLSGSTTLGYWEWLRQRIQNDQR